MSAAIQGPLLLPYQKRWVEDRAQVKIVEKSRRVGLSYAEAVDSVIYAAGQDGTNCYYMSYAQEMTTGFIQDCATWARALNSGASEIDETLIQEGDRSILAYAIHFNSGHKIQALKRPPESS